MATEYIYSILFSMKNMMYLILKSWKTSCRVIIYGINNPVEVEN